MRLFESSSRSTRWWEGCDFARRLRLWTRTLLICTRLKESKREVNRLRTRLNEARVRSRFRFGRITLSPATGGRC